MLLRRRPHPSYVKMSDVIGASILVGDFTVILSSGLFAVYATYSPPILSKKKCPISLYLTLLSAVIVILSLIMARICGEHIAVFSRDPIHGLFGFASTSYLISSSLSQ